MVISKKTIVGTSNLQTWYEVAFCLSPSAIRSYLCPKKQSMSDFSFLTANSPNH